MLGSTHNQRGEGDRILKPWKESDWDLVVLTLLNTVLLGALVVGVLLLLGDTLNALVEVVLVGGALGGVGALCRTSVSQLMKHDVVLDARENK